jgi:putative ABC transport system permease protein
MPFGRSKREKELDEEVRSHLEMAAQERVERGEALEEAKHATRREFGNVRLVKEVTRDMRGSRWMEDLIEDARYGLRRMRKSPGFTAIAVLTLALGIGANTAIFSLVNGILLVPLPYPKPEQLVSVTGFYPKGALVAMREQVRTMQVAGYAEGHEFNLSGVGEPIRLTGALVSAELFSILGARPELGRTFYPGEDTAGQDRYVILSHSLWQQRFAADVAIVGRSIILEGVSREVVGVMPASFRFPSTKTQVWIPLHNDPQDHGYWADDFMPVIGRLRPGSSLPEAHAEIRLFQSRIGAMFPWPMPAEWNANVSALPLQNGMVADVRTRFLMLLGAVAMVLLIACANVANLMLSRAATREREIAVRAAMGASRLRIVRQLLTESVLLASAGSLIGLFIATEGLTLLRATLPADTPRLADVQMDWRVLAFTGGLAVLTGLIFGLAPALHISRAALTESLKSTGRGAGLSVSQRLRGGLAVAEIAFAVLLVIGAGLLIRSFWALSHVNPGFQAEHILTARVTPDESFCRDAARCVSFYRSLLDRIQGLPGVSAAALVNTLPLGGRVTKRALDLEDFVARMPGTALLFWMDVVTPDYFQVMDIPLVSGRGFTAADTSGNPPVAVVTAATARRYWPQQNPVGKHIRLTRDKDWYTVVGVVGDVRAYNLQRNEPDWIDGTVYVPDNPKATQEDGYLPAQMTIAVRTKMDESEMGGMLRQAVAGLNQEAPVSEVKTMRTVVSESVSTPRSTTLLFATFAGVALTLGTIGIYGVLSFLVSNRTREIGIRIAMGAQRRSVQWLVIKEGAKFAFTGIALGLAGALALTQLLSSELYGVSSRDPITFLGVTFLVAAVALLACYVPARRAMRVDPVVALRHE